MSEREVREEHIERVRSGHGGNCSSIGSVIDVLFASATVGTAVFAAVLGALRTEEVRVVSAPASAPEPASAPAAPPSKAP